ncbi:superoxide dismutase family protein [Antarcticirhabdus aurantiaca]|uniref:Superoxide dismutase family protein n=1 Tax=Antarcticirhabdus aurantiaca TaxID=2606717 RepID=A0ACD4NTH0_9HYPH|nr:superoxide dismutase family protein [Antarcticirhabdus aurantiaca]WAJ30107.1 superoxide dismutase family protein [Jeongeuplla avenae]
MIIRSAGLAAALLLAAAPAALAQNAGSQEAITIQMKAPDGTDHGTVTVTSTPHGLLFAADLTGLPEGEHGFHVHAVGQCEGDFESAGGHYNPTDKDHGYLAENGPHAGDLPNLESIGGMARFSAFSPMLTMTGGDAPVMDSDGSAVMVHAGPDDYLTNPSGHSGGRIACGVIPPAP